MAGETILIVDDDEDIREILTMYLENEGYKITASSNGTQALEYAYAVNPDLIILDMMMPDLDGIEVCQELRKTIISPIIFLSSRSSPNEKSLGLIAGGDDYISKPFEPVELIARVKAHLRRNRILKSSRSHTSTGNRAENVIAYEGFSIDLDSHLALVNGTSILLAPKEFQLLNLLINNPNQIFSNEELFNTIWGTDSMGDIRTVMVHISNLRKKIEPDPKNPVYIQTLKGFGYRFTQS